MKQMDLIVMRRKIDSLEEFHWDNQVELSFCLDFRQPKSAEEFDGQHKLSPFPFAFVTDFLTVNIPTIVILLPRI